MEQRTPEWFAKRLGKVTASRIADLMAKTKTGPGASRANYLAQLVTERLTGTPTEGFQSPAMDMGYRAGGRSTSRLQRPHGRSGG
jgi:hypothetical protein